MNKVYIEAGANDGIFQSRTLSLKDKDFGILIEPHLETYNKCCENRQNYLCKVYNCALVSFDYNFDTIDLGLHEHTAMNSILYKNLNTVSVKARTLQSILDENNISIVENFFLDTEGYENEILKGIDFNKTKFKNIEIECHASIIGITVEEEINTHITFLNDFGYKLIKILLNDGNPKLILINAVGEV